MEDNSPRLDLVHLQAVAAVLDAIPAGTSLPRALLALEDASVCCYIASSMGVSLEKAREIHREEMTREETRRVLVEHGITPQ